MRAAVPGQENISYNTGCGKFRTCIKAAFIERMTYVMRPVKKRVCSNALMLAIRLYVISVDCGFIIYWSIVSLNILPNEYMFKDYDNSIIHDWNYSFLPLDIMISATGLSAMWFQRKDDQSWYALLLISMTLTFCSGLQAISFWSLRNDFDFVWWVPNLILMIGPLYFVPMLLDYYPLNMNQNQ